jgi:CBS domain-containing protein
MTRSNIMSVGRLCIRDVDLAEVSESAWQAAERMHQHGVGTLVVADADRKPIGILTDRDLVERVLARNIDPHETTVGEVMTERPTTIPEGAPIESALRMMRSGRFRRLPVVDGKGQLVGLLSLDDVLMLIAEEFADIGQLLSCETPRAVAEDALIGG